MKMKGWGVQKEMMIIKGPNKRFQRMTNIVKRKRRRGRRGRRDGIGRGPRRRMRHWRRNTRNVETQKIIRGHLEDATQRWQEDGTGVQKNYTKMFSEVWTKAYQMKKIKNQRQKKKIKKRRRIRVQWTSWMK
jgi:hypothetical protein